MCGWKASEYQLSIGYVGQVSGPHGEDQGQRIVLEDTEVVGARSMVEVDRYHDSKSFRAPVRGRGGPRSFDRASFSFRCFRVLITFER